MLREALDWLITPSLPFARRSGHLSEFVAIAARRRRHLAAWEPHEERTRAAIRHAAALADPDTVAVVLGAGHLNDVPIADLSARFRGVRLVDLAFAPSTRRTAERLGNVTCLQHDVTESLPDLGRVVEPRFLLDDPAVGFVASVNLLSQLAVVPTREMAEAESDRLGRALVEAHLAWLRRFPCPVAAVFDLAIEIVGRDSAVVATLDPLKGASAPAPDESWVWDIAPAGEVDRDHAVRHVVGAVWRLR